MIKQWHIQLFVQVFLLIVFSLLSLDFPHQIMLFILWMVSAIGGAWFTYDLWRINHRKV